MVITTIMTSPSPKIIIFGGSSGIGLASAVTLARRNFTVTIVGREREKLDSAIQQTSITAAQVDARSDEAVQTFFKSFGPFDHLIMTLSGAKGAGPFSS